MSGDDISGITGSEDVIDLLFDSIFSPQFTRQMMNRENTNEEDDTSNGTGTGTGADQRQHNSRYTLPPSFRSNPNSVRIFLSTETRTGPTASNIIRIGNTLLPSGTTNSSGPLTDTLNQWARMMNNVQTHGNTRNILQMSMNDTGGIIKKASPEFIKTLCPPREVPNESVCSVCQDDICENDRENLLELPCGHIYDKDCILEWFKKSSSCPFCRKEFDSIEVSLRPTSEDISGENSDGVEGEGDGAEGGDDGAEEQIENSLINMLEGVINNMTPIQHHAQVSRSVIADEDAILQETILRSLRDV